MRKSTAILIVSSLIATVTLVCALANDEAAAQAITVTPADPTISVDQTQQFTATGITQATAVDAGAYHTCALLQDGSVRCWGLNSSGELGDGTTTSSPTPVAVTGIMGAAAVTGGARHTCARFPDGTLECWGQNDFGQLGDPATTTFFSATPVRVAGIATATAVTAGGYYTCALLPDGSVRCWGQNDFGELGDGTTISSRTPVAVSGITAAVAISAGAWHTCALLPDGSVRCWGRNDDGQLGDGTTTTSPTPVAVSGITTAVAIEAGIFHTCAILGDGTVRCWGRNDTGQLGDGTTISSPTPVAVSGITTAAAIDPFGFSHTCALLQDGTLQCWGANTFGQLGNGSGPGTMATTPAAAVTGITTATAVTSGADHICAPLPDGSVQCWGRGTDGRLGDGTTTDAPTPVTVAGMGVTWTSSDTAVAAIDATGLATGHRPGATTITATSGGRSGSTTLTVVTRPSLSVIREGTGSGTVASSPPGIDCGATCSASYESGTVVTLTATPATGSTFTGWSGAGCSGTGTCTMTMTAATTVTATFDLLRFTLTASKTGMGSGTVTSSESPPRISCGAACSASYESGTMVTLRATPAAGSTFTGWSGCDVVSGTTCTVTMSAARSVTATFDLLRFTLTVGTAGIGRGTVTSSPAGISCGATCSASYVSGTVVTLTATPNLGSVFAGWSGGCSNLIGTCTVTMTADTAVTATFLGVPLP